MRLRSLFSVIIGAGFLGGCQSTVIAIMPLVPAAAKIFTVEINQLNIAQAKDPSRIHCLFWNAILIE